ncbi:MAG: hypothetical protein QM778_27940 [Myxococcales bacterium]
MTSRASMLVFAGFVPMSGCPQAHPLDLGYDEQGDFPVHHDARVDAEVKADAALGDSNLGDADADADNDAASDFMGMAPVDTPPARLEFMFVVVGGCDQGCLTIDVVARGGNPPYRVAWQDGPTTESRSLCPGMDLEYVVEVRDQADPDGPLHYMGQSARASLTANVTTCPDTFQIATQSLP